MRGTGGTVVTTGRGEYAVLSAALPGHGEEPVGVLLYRDPPGELHWRLRRDWGWIADPDDREVFALLDEDLARKRDEMGGAGLVEFLESHLSHVLRLSARRATMVHSPRLALNSLYDRHVVPVPVREYVTHLPWYDLKATGGAPGPDALGELLEWVEVTDDVRAREGLFVAQVTGDSMEPEIPSGSLCVFRQPPAAGSRQGRIVLAQYLVMDDVAEYTVKVYQSEKELDEATGQWHHTGIRLEPLNPRHRALVLDEGQVRVVADFVRLL